MLQNLLHPKRQRRKATAHVRIAGRKPDLDPCSHRKRIHRSASSPRKTRSSASTSTSRSTITRRPFALTTSIRPAVGNDPVLLPALPLEQAAPGQSRRQATQHPVATLVRAGAIHITANAIFHVAASSLHTSQVQNSSPRHSAASSLC
ncbi:hypothetical protein D3C87_1618660 [compost metagenome]